MLTVGFVNETPCSKKIKFHLHFMIPTLLTGPRGVSVFWGLTGEQLGVIAATWSVCLVRPAPCRAPRTHRNHRDHSKAPSTSRQLPLRAA